MRIARTALGLAMAVALVIGGVGCGSDDGANAASGSASGSGSGSGAGSASGSADGTCQPAGEDLEDDADATVDVELSEYRYDPDTIEVDAGTVTFAADNVGNEDHELAFLPGGGEVPLDGDGQLDEDALADAGAFELEGFGPGQTCNGTFELEAGTYTIFCALQTPEGRTHASLGMTGEVTVS